MRGFVLIFLVVFATSSGEHNSSEETGLTNTQTRDGAVERLVRCSLDQEYPDLSELSFNPTSVREEDMACLSLHMFHQTGFVQHFNLSEHTLARFILQVQKGYHTVPYHNFSHGFRVFHFVFAVLKNCQLVKQNHLTPLEGLALLTAALCHDIDHPGTNNQFQREVNSSLAQQYAKHGSILERHHINVTLGILRNPNTNFLAHLDKADYNQVKELITQIILATDLSVHFRLHPLEKQMAVVGFNKTNDRHRELLRSLLISCADLGDQTRDWATVRRTAKLVYEEFFAQGDEEKKLGLVPVTMMDRELANIPQQQVEFLQRVVLPDFRVLLSLYSEVQPWVNQMKQNLRDWERAIPYFQEQRFRGRQSLYILADRELDDLNSWHRAKLSLTKTKLNSTYYMI